MGRGQGGWEPVGGSRAGMQGMSVPLPELLIANFRTPPRPQRRAYFLGCGARRGRPPSSSRAPPLLFRSDTLARAKRTQRRGVFWLSQHVIGHKDSFFRKFRHNCIWFRRRIRLKALLDASDAISRKSESRCRAPAPHTPGCRHRSGQIQEDQAEGYSETGPAADSKRGREDGSG